MFVVCDVLFQDGHLSSSDACADVAHAVVVADGGVLVVRVGVTGLGGVPEDFIGLFFASTDEGASAGGGNHLVTVEGEDAVFAECA